MDKSTPPTKRLTHAIFSPFARSRPQPTNTISNIKDLYSITWKEGERTQDKKNPELTHMSDGLGYLCVSHEDSEGLNQVGIMREAEIQDAIALRQERGGYFVSPKGGKATAGAFPMVR